VDACPQIDWGLITLCSFRTGYYIDHNSYQLYNMFRIIVLPQAKFIMFEKSGHYPFNEEPELHTKVLVESYEGI